MRKITNDLEQYVTFSFLSRKIFFSGSPGGLLAKVKVNQNQYAPWTEISGIRVSSPRVAFRVIYVILVRDASQAFWTWGLRSQQRGNYHVGVGPIWLRSRRRVYPRRQKGNRVKVFHETPMFFSLFSCFCSFQSLEKKKILFSNFFLTLLKDFFLRWNTANLAVNLVSASKIRRKLSTTIMKARMLRALVFSTLMW